MKELIKTWKSFSPTEIIFGVGEFLNINLYISLFNFSKVLIIFGGSSLEYGRIDYLTKKLSLKNNKIFLANQINGEPNTSDIIKIVEKINNNNIDLIIAIGGGSVLDAGKAASVIALNNFKSKDLIEGIHKAGPNKVKLIAIPTTAGTGSELSFGSIINSNEKKKKFGIRGRLVAPDLAIIDPSLTITCTREQTSICGFDIFTHALETMISKKATPLTTLFSKEAISKVPSSLIMAMNNLENIDYRIPLSYYSMLMGYNLGNSSTCLPHRLQYPLGALTNTPHAVGLAAIYKSWIKFTNKVSNEKFSWVSKNLSEKLKIKDTGIENSIAIFLEQLELNIKLSDFLLDEDDCIEMASKVSGSLHNDPWWNDKKDLQLFYLDSL